MPDQKIVAVGLLTEYDLRLLGEGFRRVYPLEVLGDFEALLRAIDAADDARRRLDMISVTEIEAQSPIPDRIRTPNPIRSSEG